MSPKISISSVDSPVGKLGLAATSKGLCRLNLGKGKPWMKREVSRVFGVEPAEGSAILNKAEKQLDEYFAGKRKKFTVPIDFREGTEFQRACWGQLRAIQYGDTRTYKWLAESVGRPRAYRAAGGACGSNPIAIIVPCHRVVGSDGSLTGFGGPGGVKMKRFLLELESSIAEIDKRIDAKGKVNVWRK